MSFRLVPPALFFVSLSFVLLPSFSVSQFPIPARPDGFPLGGPSSSPVVFEGFFDLLCPDSKAAWPAVKETIQHYNGSVHFRLHLFPLPYHTNSFVLNQGAHIIWNNASSSSESVFDYTDLIFKNQDRWGNIATADQPMTSTIASVGSVVAAAGLVADQESFIAGIADSDLNWAQRVQWKYGCSRGVTGTPSYLINGAAVSASPTYQLSDWVQIIDPLLAPQPTASPATVRMLEEFKPIAGRARDDPVCKPGQPICHFLPGKYECCLPGESCIPNVGCRC